MPTVQIHLTGEESEQLRLISQRTGRAQGELLREALDLLFARYSDTDRLALLRRARGIWRDREDLPDLMDLRTVMDHLGEEAGKRGMAPEILESILSSDSDEQGGS